MAADECAPGAAAGRRRGPAAKCEEVHRIPTRFKNTVWAYVLLRSPQERLYISINGWPSFKHFYKSAIQFEVLAFAGFVWLPVDHNVAPIIIREFRDMEVEVRCIAFDVVAPASAPPGVGECASPISDRAESGRLRGDGDMEAAAAWISQNRFRSSMFRQAAAIVRVIERSSTIARMSFARSHKGYIASVAVRGIWGGRTQWARGRARTGVAPLCIGGEGRVSLWK